MLGDDIQMKDIQEKGHQVIKEEERVWIHPKVFKIKKNELSKKLHIKYLETWEMALRDFKDNFESSQLLRRTSAAQSRQI